jgi:hypothetical protein
VSRRFRKLAAQAGVPVIKRHEGGRHTGNSLMRDARVDQEVRMREVGHAGRDINDRYTHVLIKAHLAAAEQTAALVREAEMSHHDDLGTFCVPKALKCPPGGPVTEDVFRHIMPGQMWWGGWGSNPRPADYESAALTG